jgi:hypothetical protein
MTITRIRLEGREDSGLEATSTFVHIHKSETKHQISPTPLTKWVTTEESVWTQEIVWFTDIVYGDRKYISYAEGSW